VAKVLVAESNTDLQQFIQACLTAAGHDVTVVPDGAAALATATLTRPDLCILDVTHGVDVCQALRGDPATALSPIMIVTSMMDVLDLDDALACGADEYLVKPFSPRNLLTHVARLLARVTDPV
jgi:DNA-binding response OmpR family regulator